MPKRSPPNARTTTRNTTRTSAGVKRSPPEATRHITTRGRNSERGLSASGTPSPNATSQTVGGGDVDHDRPAKRIRRSSSPNQPADQDGSSPLSAAAEDLQPETFDDEGDEAELDEPEASGGIEPVDTHDADLLENGDDDVGSELPSRAASPLSRASTPAPYGSVRASPARELPSPTKLKGRVAKLAQTNIGRVLGRGTPDLDGPGGILKRLPGRRRAHHPDMDIEVDLRRQLELKVAYRAVAKALKPLLAELADRTAKELTEDEELLKEYPEYDEIVSELDLRLQQRLAMTKASSMEEEARFEREYVARQAIIKERVGLAIRDLQDDWTLRCYHDALKEVRKAREGEDSEATEYEDDVVPTRYHLDIFKRDRVPIPDGYDSRSRKFVTVQDLWDNLEDRLQIYDEQETFDPSSLNPVTKDFAVFDGSQRRSAVTTLNLMRLVDAAEEVEQYADFMKKNLSYNAVPNLHLLADVAKLHAKGQHPLPPQPTIAVQKTPKKPTGAATARSPSVVVHSPRGVTAAANATPRLSEEERSASGKKRETNHREHPLPPPPPPFDLYPPPPPGFDPMAFYAQFGYPPPMYPGPPPMPLPPHLQQPPPLAPSALPDQERDRIEHERRLSHQDRERMEHERRMSQQDLRRAPSLFEQAPTGFGAARLPTIEELRERDAFQPRQAPVPTPREDRFAEQTQPDTQSRTPRTSNSMGPSYQPRYVRDNGLVRPPSPPARSPMSPVAAPSKPTEWPGFSTNASHGRASSFESKGPPRPGFPTLATSNSFERRKLESPKDSVLEASTARNDQTVSSPDSIRQDSSWPPYSRAVGSSSNPFMPGLPRQSSSGWDAFASHTSPLVPKLATESTSSTMKGFSPTNDPRQHFQPPTANPMRRQSGSLQFSPPQRESTMMGAPRSRPASPRMRDILWSSSNVHPDYQHHPPSRTSSPFSPYSRPSAHDGTQTSAAHPGQPPAPSSGRLPPLQPYGQLQQPGQQGFQPILPANVGFPRRSSQEHLNSSISSTSSARQPGADASQSRHSPNPYGHESSRQPKPAGNGSFRLPKATEPSPPSHPQRSPQQPPQQYQYPPQQPPAQGRTGSQSGGRRASRNKEPRPPGQLRWQHYIDIAPAPVGAPGGSGPQHYPVDRGQVTPSASARYQQPQPPSQTSPQSQNAELQDGATSGMGAEERKAIERGREKEKRERNLQGWVTKSTGLP